ncbi:MAG: glutaminyl-peptide cyclotransferase [Polyangiales bacterium]
MLRDAGTNVQPAARQNHRSSRTSSHAMMIGVVLALVTLGAPSCDPATQETVTPVEVVPATPTPSVESLTARVLRRYPHDPGAFTQGLLWTEGSLYESTGQYGQSTVRRVRLEDGRVLDERRLDRRFFGEGLARVNQDLIQLTWREGVAIVSGVDNLRERRTMNYAGEGWGLCYDGESLVMSNGSSTLTFRDPDSMQIVRHVNVRLEGRAVSKLNELECVDGQIYANVWRRHEILRIDPTDGRVTGVIDARGLLSEEESRSADVLNGIAFRPDSKTFLVTGKYWPTLFEVEFVPR